MDEYSRLAMYEAQAIAIEKQMEVDRLKKERDELIESFKRLGRSDYKEHTSCTNSKHAEKVINELKAKNDELEERLKKLETDRDEESPKKNLDKLWEAVNGLTGQFANIQDQIQEVTAHLNRLQETTLKLQQKMEENSAQGKPAIRQDKKEPATKPRNRHVTADGRIIAIPNKKILKNLPKEVIPAPKKVENIFKKDTILIIGGMTANKTPHDKMILLSNDRTKWLEVPIELPYLADDSGAVVLDEELYLFGGYNNLTALYKLDKNNKWIRLADMNFGRNIITNSCLAWNGYIWVFGGEDEKGNCLKSVERYDPKEDKWTIMPDMKFPRAWAAAVIWNNRIIVSGGLANDQSRNNTIECFNPDRGIWTEFANFPKNLAGHCLLSYEKKIIAMGGTDGETICNNVWGITSPESRESIMDFSILGPLGPVENRGFASPLCSMKNPSVLFAGIVLEKEIYAIGGCQENYKPQCRVEIFDGKQWRDGPALPYPIYGMSSVIISPGKPSP